MKKLLSLLLLVGFMMPLMVSCGSDDEEEVPDNSTSSSIKGMWHSFKATFYLSGQSATEEVTKTGDLSFLYFEMNIKGDGTLVFSGWSQGENGQSRWIDGPGKYVVKGDVVSVTDSSGDTMDFVFDSKDKTLCLPINTTVSGSLAKVNVYLKKK